MEDAVLLLLEVGVVGLLPGLQCLKGDTLLPEKRPQSLVADVLDHPLSHQVVGQFRERPGGEGFAVVGRTPQGDLLHGPALGQGELGRSPTGVARFERAEAILVEVVEHRSDSVLGGEGDLGDLWHVHPLGAPQNDLGSAPLDHRARSSSDDPEQLVASSLLISLTRTRSAMCTTLRDRQAEVVDAPTTLASSSTSRSAARQAPLQRTRRPPSYPVALRSRQRER